jgi:hypothetical protein
LSANDKDIPIVVSPAMLVLKSKGPPAITLHANVPLPEVIPDSIRLIIQIQGGYVAVPPVKVFADLCGDLVAKFDTAVVKDNVRPPSATLFIEWVRLDGSVFSGLVLVKVK